MSAIIRDLPFFEKHTPATVPSSTVRIKPYQIILWVSILPKGMRTIARNAPRHDPGATPILGGLLRTEAECLRLLLPGSD